MKCYAKIITAPDKDEEEYEYRYRCCHQEYKIKFRRRLKGRWKGRFVVLAYTGVDLRYRGSEEFKVNGCQYCGEPIPRPWLGQNVDAFLQPFREPYFWAEEEEEEEEKEA